MFIGCTTIPKESIFVSKSIGEQIKINEISYLNLTNKYFELKSQMIDEWIRFTYLPKLIDNINKALEAKKMNPCLNKEQIADILFKAIVKRNSMQSELEKTRIIVVEKIRNNYSNLTRANRSLTDLLKSASKVQDLIEEKSKKHLGIEFDFEEFDKTFDKYLKQANDGTKKAEKLYEKAREFIR